MCQTYSLVVSSPSPVAHKVAPLVGSRGIVVGLDINADKIGIAHAAAQREHLTIEWYTSPAGQLPFPDEHFDLILCQFGLMLFTGKPAALQEMQRVLKKNGRLVLSVWQGLDRHPFYQTLHEISSRHLGISSVQAVLSPGVSDELRKLLIDSGFSHVAIEPMSIMARFPNPEEFLAWEIDVDPEQTPALKNPDHEAQRDIMAAVRRDMQSPLDDVLQDHQVVLQFHAHIAQARK